MLGASDFNRIKGSFEQVIALLGVPAALQRAKNPAAGTTMLTVGFKTAGDKDSEIINAYGINAIIITVAAKDVTLAPEKFDSLTINGVRHTADAVHPVHLNGTIIGWKIYVKGSN